MKHNVKRNKLKLCIKRKIKEKRQSKNITIKILKEKMIKNVQKK